MNIEQALQKTLGFGAKTFIEKAIEGGWKESMEIDKFEVRGPWIHGNPDFNESATVDLFHADTVWYRSLSEILLDPLVWQAVGKVEGWRNPIVAHDYNHKALPDETWKDNMHRFIDTLTEEV